MRLLVIAMSVNDEAILNNKRDCRTPFSRSQ